MNLIPVSRRSEKRESSISFADTITLCEKFMEYDQRNIVIFPEGSRGTSDKILPFRKGAARFSQALKKPIVPIYISGSSKSWPKGKIFMRPCRIRINILEPIKPIINCCKHSKMIEAFFYSITDQGYIHMTVMIAAKNSR